MVTYITKANDNVLSHCTCKGVIASGPAQMDCPWCGCGWLITCMNCRKAFTFARVIELDSTYEDIAAEDQGGGGQAGLAEGALLHGGKSPGGVSRW